MQQTKSRRNCSRLHKMILRNCDLILDDEKYFTLTNASVGGNRYYYSTNPDTAPVNIKLKKKSANSFSYCFSFFTCHLVHECSITSNYIRLERAENFLSVDKKNIVLTRVQR